MPSVTQLLKEEYLSAKRALFDKRYHFLNDEQREAVFTVNGPLLVLAGAGTGKTTVLVNRMAHIIRYGNAYYDEAVPTDLTSDTVGRLKEAATLSDAELEEVLDEFIVAPCPPWAMLCITFTNKAANEMKQRLSTAIGEEYAEQVWAGTFHSVCVRLLRRFGEKVGYSSSFTIYDTDDTKRLILSCMKELNIDDKRLPAKTVMNEISSQKNKLKTPTDFSREAGADFRLSQIASVYALYQKRLREASALDFDDIIMQTVTLLEEDEETRSYCQGRFKYVSVDEFQDTNYAQLRLVELLSGRYRNLMVVGDDDQSIYRFRGATIENILGFDREYTDAKVVRLEKNYRSTSYILDAANAVIHHNASRHEKSLISTKDKGDKLTLKPCEDQNDEARYIVNKVIDLSLREKRKYSDFAVLYRMNAQSQSIERTFARSGIPYRVVGGNRFYDRKEVKDILAYLQVILNHRDDLRLKRIINEPKRKIGEKTVSDVEYLASLHNCSMFEVMKEASLYPQICKSAERLSDFVTLIERLAEISQTEPLSVLFERTIDMSGYRQMLIQAGESEADRLKNVEELISTALEYQTTHEEATLQSYLEEVALLSDIDNYDDENNAVVLMTMHSAKGLEFPVVFLPGLEEGIFPGTQSVYYPDELEEERRLMYVAITRAKDLLFITNARERLLYGRTQINPPSKFLSEIPKELVAEEEKPSYVPPARQTAPKATISKEFYTTPAIKAGKQSFERFQVGRRVWHAAFGVGTVLSVRDLGADLLYEISFDNSGTKKLMATYAKLKPSFDE